MTNDGWQIVELIVIEQLLSVLSSRPVSCWCPERLPNVQELWENFIAANRREATGRLDGGLPVKPKPKDLVFVAGSACLGDRWHSVGPPFLPYSEALSGPTAAQAGDVLCRGRRKGSRAGRGALFPMWPMGALEEGLLINGMRHSP